MPRTLGKQQRIVLGVVIAALAASCAHRPPKEPQSQEAPVSIEMRLEHLEGSDAWRATYQFSPPISVARFERENPRLGRSAWKFIEPAGLTLERVGARQEVVRRSDGQPFEKLVVELSTRSEPQEKDYEPFIRFQDGGVLAFTGQFHLTPLACPSGAACRPEEWTERVLKPGTPWTFVPRPGEKVVVLGEVRRGPIRWVSSEEGTYVYFGSSEPVVSEHMVGVVDAGAPPWLRERVHSLLPQVFAFYTERLGHPLGFKPVVFLSFTPPTSSTGSSFGGGSLPGLIQLDVRPGAQHGERDAYLAERVDYLIAHEAAHLWNDQLFRARSQTGDWLHEGSADAFALRALHALGFLGEERFRELTADNFSMCWLGLGGAPLKESSHPGRYKNYYSCGSTLAVWTEALVSRAGPKQDLFQFWGRLFSASTGHTYDDALFYRVLGTYAGGAEAATAMRRLVEGPAGGAEHEATQALHALGMTVRPVTPGPSSSYPRWAGLQALVFATAGDCGSPLPLQRTPAGYRVRDASGCQHLKEGDTFSLIEGRDPEKDGPGAYDAVVAACTRGGPITLSTPDSRNTLQLTCPRTLRPRSAYQEVLLRSTP